MKLRTLEVAGFKSFAHKTRFQFDDGITGIIGPNGSGKSNCADAIRWVLGEQSLKSLRGQQTADVIFAGNTNEPRRGQARVSLTFDNEDGRLPIDAAEVTITRSVTRSGDGEYQVNGDPVRLLDIQQALAEAGLGTKSYAVISQGTVDRYLTATPAARRELFDEATGIKALQLKLNQAERTLHQVTQQAHEVHAILHELEPRRRVLARQVERQTERHELEERFRHEQAQYYHVAWHRAEQELAATTTAAAVTASAAAAARAERTALEQQVLAALDIETPTAALEQELARTEAVLTQAHAAITQRNQQRADVADSLATVERGLIAARATLTAARREVAQHSFFTELRTLLEQCQVLLEHHRTNQSLPDAQVAQLHYDLTIATTALSNEDTILAAAQSLSEHLEGPLQAVARLEAISQERRHHLEQLPPLPPPDDTTLRTLQAQLETTSRTRSDHRTTFEHQLAALRERELAAERAVSAASAAHDQARTHHAQLEQEIHRERGSRFMHTIQQTVPPDDSLTAPALEQLKHRLASLGDVDPLALKEYTEVNERFEYLTAQLHDVTTSKGNTEQLIQSLHRDIDHRFRDQFTHIQRSFAHHFTHLFGGGSAELNIVEAPLETAPDPTTVPPTDESTTTAIHGIDIVAHPPGKKPSHVGLLSGGERALTSLALILAIIEIQRPPFVVLDEVDAALDEANSYRFATLLKEMSTHTQCVVITHNRETMSQANVLYGITMSTRSISEMYSVNMDDLTASQPTT